MSETTKGWECPRCGSVNAPNVKKCKCVKTEGTDGDKRQLLTEIITANKQTRKQVLES